MKKSSHNTMGWTPDKAYEGILTFCLAQVTLHSVLGTAHQERWKIKVKLQECLEVKKISYSQAISSQDPEEVAMGLACSKRDSSYRSGLHT